MLHCHLFGNNRTCFITTTLYLLFVINKTYEFEPCPVGTRERSACRTIARTWKSPKRLLSCNFSFFRNNNIGCSCLWDRMFVRRKRNSTLPFTNKVVYYVVWSRVVGNDVTLRNPERIKMTLLVFRKSFVDISRLRAKLRFELLNH